MQWANACSKIRQLKTYSDYYISLTDIFDSMSGCSFFWGRYKIVLVRASPPSHKPNQLINPTSNDQSRRNPKRPAFCFPKDKSSQSHNHLLSVGKGKWHTCNRPWHLPLGLLGSHSMTKTTRHLCSATCPPTTWKLCKTKCNGFCKSDLENLNHKRFNQQQHHRPSKTCCSPITRTSLLTWW